ncbi:hypothetical protein ACHAPM_010051 [Fusarium culmorum]
MEETSDSFHNLEGQPDQPRPIINHDFGDENHEEDEISDSSDSSETDDDEEEEESHKNSNQDIVQTYEQQAKEFKDQATHIKAQLDRQMDTFASQSPDNDNTDARNRFYRQFRHDMAPPKAQILKHLSVWQCNILYYIADEKQSERPCDWLVGRLAKEFPSLLDERIPNGGLTVLLKSVKEHNFAFIKAILDSGIRTTDLAKIIMERDTDKKNCFHYAVSDGFDPEIAIRLLQHAAEETLGHQDNKGPAPLHYAVEYERCLPEREEMIKALIKRSDAAFDLRSGKPEELSVYQHHVRSREKYGKKKELRRMERERKEKEKQKKDSKEKSGDAPSGKHETGAMYRKDEAKNSKRMSEQPNRIGFKMREGANLQVPGGLESNNMDTLQLLAGSKRDARDQNQFVRPLRRTRT